MMNRYVEDLKDMIEEHGILKGILYSDVFNPIYKLFNLPKRLYNYLSRFYYYGKAGASNTYDFDSSGIDDLIYAHIKRVRKYMDSDKTHLMWNSERDRGLIRKLYEFEELCRRKCEHDDFNDLYYFGKEYDKYGMGTKKEYKYEDMVGYAYEQSDKVKALWSKARKKDQNIARQRMERYYELLRKYVPNFWD